MGMQSSSSDSTSHQDELTWRAQHTPPPIPNPSRDNSRADRNSRFLPSALPTRGANHTAIYRQARAAARAAPNPTGVIGLDPIAATVTSKLL
ncbi:hypothetical protein E8E15_003056 [Penicillium rubens]|nr:hypothetical protein E8E15_003056 [Penicillium rubens]